MTYRHRLMTKLATLSAIQPNTDANTVCFSASKLTKKPALPNIQRLNLDYKLDYAKGDSKKGMVWLLSLIILSALISGCDRRSDTNAQAEQSSQTVTLSKEDIFSTKSERYQPSFNLSGELVPTSVMKVLTLEDAVVDSIMVAQGDWVEADDPLVRLRLNSVPDANANTGNLDELAQSRAPIELSNESSNNTSNGNTFNNNNNDKTQKQESVVDNQGIEEDDLKVTNAVNNNPSTVNHSSSNTDNITVKEGSITNNSSTQTSQKKLDSTIGDESSTSSDLGHYLTLEAPQAGEVLDILVTPKQSIEENQPLMTLADTQQLQLIGELPLESESQLAVGHAVNFTVLDVHQSFTGQISNFEPNATGDKLIVYALVNQSEDTQTHLEAGMQANMSINYGQIQVGMLLPRRGIHDVDLSELSVKHTRPTSPLHGYVWVIEQDQSLTHQPVEVVQYYPDSDQFLVSGINNDSLVCLTDLSLGSEGKIAIVR